LGPVRALPVAQALLLVRLSALSMSVARL